jgi:hypothetical protein
MTRVVWTKEEKQTVFDNMVEHLAKNPTLSGKQVLQQGQSILPYERRGKTTDQRVFAHKDRILAARTEAAKRRVMEDMAPVSVPMEYAKPSVGDLFEQLVDALTERVLSQVTDRLKDRLTGDVSEIAGNRLEELFGHPMDKLDAMFDALHPPKPRKPTCLVVGLNGAQMESIKRRVPHVDFKFFTAEEAVSHYTCTKDHTVLMTKFINHSVQGKYRKHPNLHYCNGGVTELNNLLNGVFK